MSQLRRRWKHKSKAVSHQTDESPAVTGKPCGVTSWLIAMTSCGADTHTDTCQKLARHSRETSAPLRRHAIVIVIVITCPHRAPDLCGPPK